MSEYIIFTDSACDLSPAALKEWNVDSCSLSFVFDGEDHQYGNHDMPVSEFYAHMRSGKVAKTSAVNPDTFAKAFKPYLEQGMDILLTMKLVGHSDYQTTRNVYTHLSQKHLDQAKNDLELMFAKNKKVAQKLHNSEKTESR